MRGTVFYTEISIPHGATYQDVRTIEDRIRKIQSVHSVSIIPSVSAFRILVGGDQRTLRYSGCPLPGSHDFAAGWLAHEAMMTISYIFKQPTAWLEGEIVGENLKLPGGAVVLHPVRRMRQDKPPVLIDYSGFLADQQLGPFSQGGQITGPGQP